jgi:hypothetical protein
MIQRPTKNTRNRKLIPYKKHKKKSKYTRSHGNKYR